MSKPAAKRPLVNGSPVCSSPWGDEPTRLVCAGLALAVLFVALRIADVWL
jgi:hypothetical protein